MGRPSPSRVSYGSHRRIHCSSRFRKPVSPLDRENQEKSEIFKSFRFEPLYQPYFDFWLFAWSRCGRIVKRSSRKDSLYQDYSVLLTSIVSSAAVDICGRNRPQHLKASWAYFGWKNHKSKHRYPSVLVISIEPGSLLVVLKMSVRLYPESLAKQILDNVAKETRENKCVSQL